MEKGNWQEFQKEVSEKIKYYFDLKIGKKEMKKMKAIWKNGGQVSEAVSYILLGR